jgi:hypothetical protein
MPEAKQIDKSKARSAWTSWKRHQVVDTAGASVLLLVMAAYFMNPGLDRHRSAWNATVSKGESVGTEMGEVIGTQSFAYHNYLIFSTMSQKPADAEDRTDSIGFLGHVFVFNHD